MLSIQGAIGCPYVETEHPRPLDSSLAFSLDRVLPIAGTRRPTEARRCGRKIHFASRDGVLSPQLVVQRDLGLFAQHRHQEAHPPGQLCGIHARVARGWHGQTWRGKPDGMVVRCFLGRRRASCAVEREGGVKLVFFHKFRPDRTTALSRFTH